jgi:putative ABC transport system ATP-binding protein
VPCPRRAKLHTTARAAYCTRVRNSSTNNPLLLHTENLRGDHFGPISLQLALGECVILQGPSGAGKTLLLRALADMDPADGEVWLAGMPRDQIPAPQWRRQVALLPAESHWWAETVQEHFPAESSEDLAAMGFDVDALHWPINRLSSGERQRLAMVRLLANRPHVLLLDEPTANLDPDNTRRVESLVKSYMQRNQAGALWVSHDAPQTARVGNRIIRLYEGRVVNEAAA